MCAKDISAPAAGAISVEVSAKWCTNINHDCEKWWDDCLFVSPLMHWMAFDFNIRTCLVFLNLAVSFTPASHPSWSSCSLLATAMGKRPSIGDPTKGKKARGGKDSLLDPKLAHVVRITDWLFDFYRRFSDNLCLIHWISVVETFDKMQSLLT